MSNSKKQSRTQESRNSENSHNPQTNENAVTGQAQSKAQNRAGK